MEYEKLRPNPNEKLTDEITRKWLYDDAGYRYFKRIEVDNHKDILARYSFNEGSLRDGERVLFVVEKGRGIVWNHGQKEFVQAPELCIPGIFSDENTCSLLGSAIPTTNGLYLDYYWKFLDEPGNVFLIRLEEEKIGKTLPCHGAIIKYYTNDNERTISDALKGRELALENWSFERSLYSSPLFKFVKNFKKDIGEEVGTEIAKNKRKYFYHGEGFAFQKELLEKLIDKYFAYYAGSIQEYYEEEEYYEKLCKKNRKKELLRSIIEKVSNL